MLCDWDGYGYEMRFGGGGRVVCMRMVCACVVSFLWRRFFFVIFLVVGQARMSNVCELRVSKGSKRKQRGNQCEIMIQCIITLWLRVYRLK